MIQALEPTLLLMLSKHLPCWLARETDALPAYGIGFVLYRCTANHISPPEATEEAVFVDPSLYISKM